MKLTDTAWAAWERKPYTPSSTIYRCDPAYGTPAEPASSLWCASLVDPLALQEAFTLLDWGCGDGRLFNFLSARFQNFRYYGLERPGDFGARCIERARSFFGHDSRATFDLYGDRAEAAALTECTSLVMGSVATHVPIDQFGALLRRVRPILGRDGAAVSCFIEDESRCLNASAYGHADCFGYVAYTRRQLEDLCATERLSYRTVDTFVSSDGSLHQILKFTGAP